MAFATGESVSSQSRPERITVGSRGEIQLALQLRISHLDDVSSRRTSTQEHTTYTRTSPPACPPHVRPLLTFFAAVKNENATPSSHFHFHFRLSSSHAEVDISFPLTKFLRHSASVSFVDACIANPKITKTGTSIQYLLKCQAPKTNRQVPIIGIQHSIV